MKKYLIVSDLDGTLADTDHYVNETTKEFIKEVLDQGHTFYIATGRMKSLVDDVAENIDQRVGVVGSNGGIIQTENGFSMNPLTNKQKHDLYHFLRERDIPTLYFSDKDVLYTHYIPEFFILSEEEGHVVKEIDNIESDLLNRDIINVLCLGNHLDEPLEVLSPLRDELKKEFHLTVTSSNPSNLEIFSKEVSKGNAVKKLMDIHNKNADEVIVFGDGFNDVSMFQVASTSVAMDNAPDEVKSFASHTTSSNAENGVVQFLRSILK